MNLITKFNTADIKKECLKCGGNNIQSPDMSKANFDWTCSDCGNRQLDYIKSKGFRYYAYLLSGSWTSKYVFARSVIEGYKLTVKNYKDKHEVYRSYMVGSADCFCLSDWRSF